MHALPETSTPTTPSSMHPNASQDLAPLVVQPHASVRLLPFLLRFHMKPQVGGPQHLMDPMLGDCASRKKLALKVTIVIPPTLNGLVILDKVTKAEGQFNFHGIYTHYTYNIRIL